MPEELVTMPEPVERWKYEGLVGGARQTPKLTPLKLAPPLSLDMASMMRVER